MCVEGVHASLRLRRVSTQSGACGGGPRISSRLSINHCRCILYVRQFTSSFLPSKALLMVLSHMLRFRPDIAHVANLDDANKWLQQGIGKIDADANDIIRLLSGRRIDTSGAFFGVGAAEIGDRIAESCSREFCQKNNANTTSPPPSHMRFVSKWAIEKSGPRRAEIARGGLAEHIFGDITDFAPPVWKSRRGLSGPASKWPPARLKAELPFANMLLQARCYTCNGQRALTRTHIHRAGT
eukprot:3729592-Pyramimonas_sp.AAC.1